MSESPVFPDQSRSRRSNDSRLAEIQYATDLIAGASERIDEEVPASCEQFLRLASLMRELKPGLTPSAEVLDEANEIIHQLFTRFQFHDAVTQMLTAAIHSLGRATDAIQHAEEKNMDLPELEHAVIRQRFIRPDQTAPAIELF